MAKTTTRSLKLFRQPPVPGAAATDLAEFAGLCNSFAAATGWDVELDRPGDAPPRETVPVEPPLSPAQRPTPWRVPRLMAQRLANDLAATVGSLRQARVALAEREAELAAGVPVLPCKEEAQRLAERLRAVLQAAVVAVNANAAGLYLLDDATTQLKLRSHWGLPPDRLAQPPRPLRGAIGDLEALSGHVVVVRDRELAAAWNVPENFAASVAVPVSTPSIPLGTLWVFAKTPRDFNARETNLLEIIAGRLAADLERDVLLKAQHESASLRRQATELELARQDQRSRTIPSVDGWELASWCDGDDRLGRSFVDWSAGERQLRLTLGATHARGLRGPVSAAAVRAALAAHDERRLRPADLLAAAGRTLWTGSAGDCLADVAALRCAIATGRAELAATGNAAAWKLRPGADGALTMIPLAADVPLGAEAHEPSKGKTVTLSPGESLLAAIFDRDEPGRQREANLTATARRRVTPAIRQALASISATTCAARLGDLAASLRSILPGDARPIALGLLRRRHG